MHTGTMKDEETIAECVLMISFPDTDVLAYIDASVNRDVSKRTPNLSHTSYRPLPLANITLFSTCHPYHSSQ